MTTAGFQETVADLARLWLGLMLPPLAWAMQMGAMYALQPWLCVHGQMRVPNDVISLLAAVVAAAGGVIAWRRRRVLASTSPEQRRLRACFMASLGMALSAMFVLVILALWLPNHLMSPCPL
jgi:hypothetical protein